MWPKQSPCGKTKRGKQDEEDDEDERQTLESTSVVDHGYRTVKRQKIDSQLVIEL
jgi:hypothetical protein